MKPWRVNVTSFERGSSFASTTAECSTFMRSPVNTAGAVHSSSASCSIRREIVSSIRTHSSGYLPIVVSPESMTQSACS